jgi:secondary thiamine-phosphate synthase enzyme
MIVKNKSFEIQSDTRPTFHNVTGEVRQFALETGIQNGILVVYSQHTTCSVVIQEQSDDTDYYGEQYLMQDMVNVLERMGPRCTTQGQYLHPGPKHIAIAEAERNEEARWSLNTDAHLRSVLLGRSVTIPVTDGVLQLGEFGVVYFADFDQVRARKRTVRISALGE